MDNYIDNKDLVPGKTYKVQISDCCVQGYFTDVFVELDRYEDGDPTGGLIFKNAFIEGGSVVEEIQEENHS